MDTKTIVQRASASGFTPIPTPHATDPVFFDATNLGLSAEVALCPHEDDPDLVEVVLIYVTYSYEHGPDFVDLVVGDYTLSDALSMLTWMGKVEQRHNAEIDDVTFYEDEEQH